MDHKLTVLHVFVYAETPELHCNGTRIYTVSWPGIGHWLVLASTCKRVRQILVQITHDCTPFPLSVLGLVSSKSTYDYTCGTSRNELPKANKQKKKRLKNGKKNR